MANKYKFNMFRHSTDAFEADIKEFQKEFDTSSGLVLNDLRERAIEQFENNSLPMTIEARAEVWDKRVYEFEMVDFRCTKSDDIEYMWVISFVFAYKTTFEYE